jgi:hypothetical protein
LSPRRENPDSSESATVRFLRRAQRAQSTVDESQHAVAAGGETFAVRGEHEGERHLALQLAQQLEHAPSGSRIEVARRLISQHDRGVRDDGACDGHALLLPAGQLAGPVVQPLAQPELFQRLAGPPQLVTLATPDTEGHLDVLERRELRQQVVQLEDETDVPVAVGGEPARVAGEDLLATKEQSAGVRGVETAEAVQEGRLADARVADDRHGLPFADFQVEPLQDADAALARAVGLVNAARAQDRLTHSGSPPPDRDAPP